MAPPFAFPDVPAVPGAAAHASSSSYISLISLLMEEEDVVDVDPDHPALLHAQQPFAQILSSAFLPDQGAVLTGGTRDMCSANDGGDLTTLALSNKDLFPGDKEYSKDVFTMAFFKGVEDATKFLPADTADKLVSGAQLDETRGGRGRRDRDDDVEVEAARASKLATAESEEARAREVFDEMMLKGYDVRYKGMEGLRIAMDQGTVKGSKETRKKNRARGKRRAAKVVDLHTLLTHCAKAVIDDRRSADELLKRIKEHFAHRRRHTAACLLFCTGAGGAAVRQGGQVYRSLTANRTAVVDFLKAYQLFTSTCCFKKVAFVFANKTIFNAAMGRSKLHIVDYGLHSGFQWRELLRLLGDRDGGPPEVRITSIDLPQPGFRPANHMAEMGHWLSNCAREFGVPFKFHAVVAQWETVCIEDLNMEPDETLVVNDLFNFRTLMDESVVIDSLSPRDVVLSNISKMKLDVFIQGIVNGSYGTFFLSRFRGALFYHSALFDMLDATMPRESQLRLVLKWDIFGWVVLNAIACEGEDRMEHGETYKQWQVRNRRASLRQLPLNRETVKMVADIVKNHYHKDFVIEEGRQWLLQGWKGRILFAHSTWVANGMSSGC